MALLIITILKNSTPVPSLEKQVFRGGLFSVKILKNEPLIRKNDKICNVMKKNFSRHLRPSNLEVSALDKIFQDHGNFITF